MFRALVLEEADGKVSSSIQELDEASLPDGDVTVAIDYSTLNYKDGMILGGIGRMVRNYPHIGASISRARWRKARTTIITPETR